MTIKRIFAGSIMALLLSVSSLAAACDLSCAFASMRSDCHSGQTESQNSAPGGMIMDGMAMPGMTMPEMASREDLPAVSAISRAKPSHPFIGEMGPCEKQACDGGSFVSTKATHSSDWHLHSILAVSETPRADSGLPLFHGARDAIAKNPVRGGNPLLQSLRI